MSEAHTLDPTILREYDIRGIVDDTLGAADLRAIGRAFGTMVIGEGGRTIAVGYDGRLSSLDLEAALVDGLAASGLKVLRVGLGPTPMLYYATHALATDAGAMITGSHNPPEYNGIKMVLKGRPFFADAIQELGRVAAAGDFASGRGKVLDRPPGFAAVLVKIRDRSLVDPRIPPVHTAGCPSVGTPAGSRDRAAIWRAWPCGR